MDKEEIRTRTGLRLVEKEERHRITQRTKERERRNVIEQERLRSLEGISRRRLRQQDKEVRMRTQGMLDLQKQWELQHSKRMLLEAEEIGNRRRVEAGSRRSWNEKQTKGQLTLTQTDITETRQYLVPVSIDFSEVAVRQVPMRYSTKRRREQPSDGRERSPRPKRLKKIWKQ